MCALVGEQKILLPRPKMLIVRQLKIEVHEVTSLLCTFNISLSLSLSADLNFARSDWHVWESGMNVHVVLQTICILCKNLSYKFCSEVKIF